MEWLIIGLLSVKVLLKAAWTVKLGLLDYSSHVNGVKHFR